jgi:acetyl esterase
MGLDPRARRFLDFLAASARTGPPDLKALRRATRAMAAFAAPAPDVERRDEVLADNGGLTLRIYSPIGTAGQTLPALIYFHGGGWISGGLDSHDALCATISASAGCRVVAVDYRLSPEHRFPQGLEDGLAAIRAVETDPERFGVDPRRLAIGGDSAGANLAAVLAREASAPLALQVLLCPVMEPRGRTGSRQEFASGYLIEEATMAFYWECYRSEGLAPDDPRVAPLRAESFARLPPALIHTAEFDPLRDEGELYAKALRRDGIAVELTVHAGMIHHFYGLGAVIPAALAPLDAIGDGLRAAFARLRD